MAEMLATTNNRIQSLPGAPKNWWVSLLWTLPMVILVHDGVLRGIVSWVPGRKGGRDRHRGIPGRSVPLDDEIRGNLPTAPHLLRRPGVSLPGGVHLGGDRPARIDEYFPGADASGNTPFCHLALPMMALPAMLSKTIIFPGSILPKPENPHAFGAMLALWVGATLILGRGWCSGLLLRGNRRRLCLFAAKAAVGED